MSSKFKRIIIDDSDDDSDLDEIIIIKKKHVLRIYEEIANNLMQKNKLYEWTFKWNTKSTKTAGWTKYDTKTIEVTKNYALKATKNEYINTVLHEIAHALVGDKAGHGPIWKKKAISIGCTGERCHNVTFTEPKYVMICGCKGKLRTRVRMSPYIKKIQNGKNIVCTGCNEKVKLQK